MKSKLAALAGTSVLAMLSPAFAQPAPTAPEAAAPAAEDEEAGEIVVTGTFIRGIAPTGNQTIGVTEEDIQASGATSTNDVLANIPQLTSMFNALNTVGVTGGGATGTVNQNTSIQVQRPALRNLGVGSALGSSPTLVLMDGHRMVGAGVNQSSPDAGVIPAGVLQRVEIVTDGGTALYGTDAVGGVLNFITRSSFDGIRVGGRYGVAEDIANYETNITAGTDWGSGSIFGAVSYSESEPLLGIDRSWYSGINWNTIAPFNRYGTGELRACATPNVSIGTTNYAVTAPTTIGAANTYNACDVTDYQTIAAEQTSTSLFAGFTQDFTDSIHFNVRGFYTQRDTMNGRGPQQGTVRVDDEVASTGTPGGSPYYVDIPGAAADGAIETVLFNYAPFNGNGFNGAFNQVGLETWGITPTLNVDLGDWQLTALANYGESETFFRNHEINADRQQYYATGNNGVVPTGSSAPALIYNTTLGPTGNNINPYNVGASNPAVLADITNWQRYGWSHQAMTNLRAVFDGPLLTLPGGQVRAALGAEFTQEEVERRAGFTNLNDEGTLLKPSIDREVTAFFGELNIPIVGSGNRFPLVESFTLSISARRDEYSDFGETTNPQVGLVWEPTEWLAIRGNWGTSFNAPAAVEVLDETFPTVGVNNTVFNWGNLAIPGLAPGQAGVTHFNLANGAPVGTVCSGGTYAGQAVCTAPATAATFRTLTINGAAPDLEPQTGETWSIGFDAHAPFLPNLRLSATYYNIKFDNTLTAFGGVSFVTTQSNYNFWNTRLWVNGTDGSGVNGAFTTSDIATFCSNAGVLNQSDCDAAAANPGSIYFVADNRLDNFGARVEEGLDVNLRYSHDFDWGTWDAGLAGNYRLNSESRAAGATVFTVTDLDTVSRYTASVNTGVTIGQFYARATVNYSAGWDTLFNNGAAVSSTSTGPFQYHVDPFIVTDLFFRYDFGEIGLADNLQITLNVDNAFDEDPPTLRQTGQVGHTNGQTLGRMVSVGLSADF